MSGFRLATVCGLAITLAMGGAPRSVVAQSAQQRSAFCVAAGGIASACAAGAVAVRQAAAQIGLMASPGAEIPGEGSTLGRRLGGMPRVAAWVRGGVQSVGLPKQDQPTSPEDESSLAPAFQLGLGLGLFDGFQLLPTVGGLLSLDVVAHASFLSLGGKSGFGDRVDVVSVGARVGLLRESFTLPGVSVSAARRISGSYRVGDIAAGDSIEVLGDPSYTSVRVTVSKDLFAFGVLAGVGWDDFSADTQIIANDALGGAVLAEGGLDDSRTLYFASVTKQLGVLAWMTLEGGWARGFGPVGGYRGGFDPGGSTVFGSVALLLKL